MIGEQHGKIRRHDQSAYAALANGGKLVTPHVVEAAERPAAGGEPAVPVVTFPASPPKDVGIDAEALRVVRDGLYEATHVANGNALPPTNTVR